MYQEERMLHILKYLDTHQRINIEEICSLFNVSRDTARRDLVRLEEQNSIIRTRGGALLSTAKLTIPSYNDRLNTVSSEKKQIGQLAATLIRDGERIILDSSTTVQACAEFVEATRCTVITNSINQADILSDKEDMIIHLLGGQLQTQHRYVYGSGAIETLSHYFAERAFIGIGSISAKGLTSLTVEEGRIKHKMMQQAEMVVILADHSKFGRELFYKFADLSEIDLIITDQAPNTEMTELLKQHEVELWIAGHPQPKELSI
ncbi:DeoR/GlpR family DNA-binding transcription regulator [Paenibacillus shenyangensis]|uniref:DeoR/GlpR family DNA-binding transcription regulator n=1 Tax=Paenibacillus sp. A9 TaxID=1284352 RepID=UPI0003643F73|nr:DeoR/GlpR family DNA-binding transcription regulator [Paenibacillus sp. A9]